MQIMSHCDIKVLRGAATREPTLRAFCFEYSVKESLLHRAGEPKLVFNWLKEESKREPQNVFLEWPRHGVDDHITVVYPEPKRGSQRVPECKFRHVMNYS